MSVRAAILLLAFGTLGSAQFNTGFRWAGGGPYGISGRVSGLAATPSGYLVASPAGGLWYSSDGATTWGAISDSTQSQQVCSMVVDPTNPNKIYLGTGDEQSLRGNLGVLRSTNFGTTWTLASGFSTGAVCGLVLDPANSGHLLAASLSGIFQSLDSGATWKQVSTAPVQSIAFGSAGVVYASTYSPTFYTGAGANASPLLKSTDGGTTWTSLSFAAPDSTDFRTFVRSTVAVSPAGTVYVAVAYSLTSTVGAIDIFVSNDGGATFTAQSKALPANTIGRLPMIYDAVNNFLYVGAASLYRTNAAAQTFTALTYPAIGNIDALAFNRAASPSALLVGGDAGFVNLPLDNSAATQLTNPPVTILSSTNVDPQNSSILYFSGENGLRIYDPIFGTYRRAVSTPVGFAGITNTNPENVYALGGNVLNRSTDGGATFKTSTAIPATESHAPYPPLLVDTIVPTTLYTAGQRAYRSTDGGATWTALSPVIDTASGGTVVTSMVFSTLLRQDMYAAVACLPASYPAPASCPATSRIYGSTNTGATWTLLSSVPGYVSRLAVDPGIPTAVYAVTGAFPGGPNVVAGLSLGNIYVIRSVGGATGVTTTSLLANLPDAPINAIVTAPAGNGIAGTLATTYYVGTDFGVFGTTNSGTSWVSLTTGLPNVPITDLALQVTTQGNALRAATYGRGYFQATVPAGTLSPTIVPLGANLSVTQGASTSMTATITNTGTTPIDYQIITGDAWLSVTPASGHLLANGNAVLLLNVDSSALATGAYRTRLQVVRIANAVSPNDFPQDITVKLTVTKPPATLVAVATPANPTVGSQIPLTVQALDAAGLPLSGVVVAFRITSGTGQLSFQSVPTDSQGNASTVLTLPATPGIITLTASVASLTANFSITSVVTPKPALNSGAAVNAASFSQGAALAPGSIFSLFGTQLATSVFTAASLPLPTTLGGTQVFLGTSAVPLFYVSQNQINAMVPFEAAAGSTQLVVQYPGAISSNIINVTIAAVAPGIFTKSSTGAGIGVFVKLDGSTVSAANPALRNTLVTFYATGLGAVSPTVASGSAAKGAPNLSSTVTPAIINIGGVDAVPQFAGLAPGFAGLYQINVLIPASVSPESNVPVTLRMGLTVSNTVTIPIS